MATIFDMIQQQRKKKPSSALASASTKQGGATVDGLLLRAHSKDPKSKPYMCSVLYTGNSTITIPAGRVKGPDGKFSIPTFEKTVELKPYEIFACSIWGKEGFEPKLGEMVRLCGVSRSGNEGQYNNVGKVIVKGDHSSCPLNVYKPPTPWDMEKEYTQVPFKLHPDSDKSYFTSQSGTLTCNKTDGSQSWVSDEGSLKIPGPFETYFWENGKVTTVDLKMTAWDPDSNLSQFGISNSSVWKTLGPHLAQHLFGWGVMTVANKKSDKNPMGESMSLMINDEKNENGFGLIAYCNYIDIDVKSTIKSCAIPVTPEYVFQHHFDGEIFVESDLSTNSSMNTPCSTIYNLNEWTGQLKKFQERSDAEYFLVVNCSNADEIKALTENERMSVLKQEPGAPLSLNLTSDKMISYCYVLLPDGPLNKKKLHAR